MEGTKVGCFYGRHSVKIALKRYWPGGWIQSPGVSQQLERILALYDITSENALLQDRSDITRNVLKQLEANCLCFVQILYKTQVANNWPNRMLEFCLKLISPGQWTYLWDNRIPDP
jgi:hypothetical protein